MTNKDDKLREEVMKEYCRGCHLYKACTSPDNDEGPLCGDDEFKDVKRMRDLAIQKAYNKALDDVYILVECQGNKIDRLFLMEKIQKLKKEAG